MQKFKNCFICDEDEKIGIEGVFVGAMYLMIFGWFVNSIWGLITL